MENKEYKFTKKTLGDVFKDKVIITDTRDIVAYILREEKNPVTGARKYKHVPHSYWPADATGGQPIQDVEYPPFPIMKYDMDLFHPHGKYLIKVVNRYDKSRSYGSITFYNKGKDYKVAYGDEKTSSVANTTTPLEAKISALEKKHDKDMNELCMMIKKLNRIVENLAAKI